MRRAGAPAGVDEMEASGSAANGVRFFAMELRVPRLSLKGAAWMHSRYQK
jgi:hypothetical protein